MNLILQKDSMQCGVAALTMISRHFGASYDVKYLENFCVPTNQGVSLRGISEGAYKIGLKATSALLTIEHLSQFQPPFILHWNQQHFVVLYKVSKDGKKFYIADPAKGKYKCSIDEFKSHWISSHSKGCERGVGMMFEKTEKFDECRRAYRKNRKTEFTLLKTYFRQHRRQILVICLCLLVASILQLILPFLTQMIVDSGIRNEDIGFIWLILLGELMIVGGRTVTDFIRRRLLLRVSMKVNISLVSDFFKKLLRLPMSFFDTKLMGDLLQRIGDHGRVQNFLTGQLLNVVFSILTFLVFGIVLLMYDAVVFLVFMGGSVIYGVWIAVFLKKRKVIDYEIFENQARNQNRTYQFVTSMQEIKLQDCEKRRREEWEEVQNDLFDVQMKSMRLQQTQEAGSVFINELKNILVTVLAATAVINGTMTLGAMLAIQYIIGQLNSPVDQLMGFIYSLQDVRLSLERINEVHNGEEEESQMGMKEAFVGEKSISITNLSFKYDRHALHNTLENISIDIPAGKVTAIVGASGSGKTTLLKLMLGYYPAIEGKINIAGHPIESYSLRWWRRQCGVVMQDGVIFSESIARNIAVGDGELDPERLEEAAKMACIHDYITSLPLGYDTIIGRDGMGLSQGQKQRILIARAVYKNPYFIFLDEATNALDAANERKIVERLEKFYEGRTVIIVAHRLSTVRNADNIMVFDKGRIVESGDHTALIAKKGKYYDLVKNQLELGS